MMGDTTYVPTALHFLHLRHLTRQFGHYASGMSYNKRELSCRPYFIIKCPVNLSRANSLVWQPLAVKITEHER
jgi:hypothetical protein